MKYTHNEFLHFEAYEQITKKFRDDFHDEVIRLSEPICKDLNEINNLNRAIWHFRSMSLDATNRCTEAVVILNHLIGLYPLEPFYRKSLRLAMLRLEINVCERYFRKSVDKSFENCLKVLEDHHYVSIEVRRIHFSYLLENKRFQEITELVNKYLDLNPYDYDYLSAGLALAEDINDNVLIKRILNIIDSIPPYHIDRIKIDGLLFTFFESKQGEDLC